jgi:DNA adenine methylase
MVEPILKWAGGKRQLLDDILPLFPDNFDTYHEPFFGGGAVFFELEPERATINDRNSRLINFYRQIRDNPEALIETLQGFDDPESDPNPTEDYADTSETGKSIEKYYYQQRAKFNKRPYTDNFNPLEEAALLLYLNRTCYNGLYRENQSGGFNSPIGSYDNPSWVFSERIQQISELLQSVDIYNRDFEYILEVASSDDVVYFDPPYKPESETASFTEYDQDGFGEEDQMRLLDISKQLAERGTTVVVSNSGIMKPRYEELEQFDVKTVSASRSINSDGDNRGEVQEILAVSK